MAKRSLNPRRIPQTVLVFETPDEAVTFAAEQIRQCALESVHRTGAFTMALSGGKTPESLYRWMAKTYKRHFPWKQTHVFWGDERWVPANSPRSNFGAAKKLLLRHVPIPASHIHRIQTRGLRPDASADRYAFELSRIFKKLGHRSLRFDLILLGVGSDGHTASLFPGTSGIGHSRQSVLVTKDRSGEVRVTFSTSLIRKARRLLFLVLGQDKRAVVRQIFSAKGTPAPKLPVMSVITGRGKKWWILDHQSAGLALLQSDVVA